jgi:hypothetical protein
MVFWRICSNLCGTLFTVQVLRDLFSQNLSYLVAANRFYGMLFLRELLEMLQGYVWIMSTTTLLMSTHASVLVDSFGPPSAEVCRTAASFP